MRAHLKIQKMLTELLTKLEGLVRISVGVKQSIALDARMRNGTLVTQNQTLSHPAREVASFREISVSLNEF